MEYLSSVEIESKCAPGVTYSIARISLSRRAELTRRIHELAGKMEFLQAGNEVREKIEAAVLATAIDGLYLEWGLIEVRGLKIDGQDATPPMVFERGPEALSREMVAAIKAECGLTDEERKNS